MKAFARLLDQLAFTPARNAKLTLLRDYLSHAPDPERLRRVGRRRRRMKPARTRHEEGVLAAMRHPFMFSLVRRMRRAARRRA